MATDVSIPSEDTKNKRSVFLVLDFEVFMHQNMLKGKRVLRF